MSQSFKPKEFVVAKTESEAIELLKKYGEKARIIAGGTGVYEVAHRGLFAEVEVLIDITRLELNYVRRDEGFLRIGSCATMSSIFETSSLAEIPELVALVDALKTIQPLQVKNVATVGGAICTALPFFDLPVSLIALDADVVIAPDGRTVKLEDFIQGYFAVDLREGEFVREILVPLKKTSSERIGSSFLKFALTGDDWAIINCGSRVEIGEQDTLCTVRLCFGGGVGEKPRRVPRLEMKLAGVKMSDEADLKSILNQNIDGELEPVSDLKASSKYRMHLAKVLARRSIIRSANVAKQRLA